MGAKRHASPEQAAKLRAQASYAGQCAGAKTAGTAPPPKQLSAPNISSGYAQLVDKCQKSPVYFCEKVLGDKLWEKQVEIMESVRDNRRTAVRSCHGAGKSFTASRTIAWRFLCNPRHIVVTTAPTFRQVKTIIWQEIHKMNAKCLARGMPLGGDLSTTEWKLGPGWFAFGFATNTPDAVQGIHSDNGVTAVLDEACGIGRDIMEGVEGILTGENSRLLGIGNPTDPTSVFADEFRVPGTNRIAISAFDTPNLKAGKVVVPGLVDTDWVEDKRRRWGEGSPMWAARVLGQFPDLSDDTLFPLSWLEAARERTLAPVGKHRIVVDVARFGSDETVRGHRTGPVFRIAQVTNKEDTTKTSGRIIKDLRDNPQFTEVVVDDDGVGGGVTDQLNAAKDISYPGGQAVADSVEILAFKGGHAARDNERFLNKRAETYWALRERAESGDLDLPDDDELISQLACLKYKITPRGQIQIESKDDMKKRGLPSPDRADCAMMAFSEGYVVPMVGATNLEQMSGWDIG